MEIDYRENEPLAIGKLMELYTDAGWTAYTDHPALLEKAVRQSLWQISAWDGEELVGLVRAVGDGASILYIQDILVKRSHQRQEIGSELLQRILRKYSDVRQAVLLTDDSPETDAFYRANGLAPVGETGAVAFMRIKKG